MNYAERFFIMAVAAMPDFPDICAPLAFSEFGTILEASFQDSKVGERIKELVEFAEGGPEPEWYKHGKALVGSRLNWESYQSED